MKRLFLIAIALGLAADPSSAQIVCPDSMSATVTFSRTFSGIYRPGEPYDVVTISPDGSGETFASLGITIGVRLRDCNGVPLVGIPAQEIVLFNSAMCICPGGNIADAPTDLEGRTTFSGSLAASGCVNSIAVFADGVFVATLPIKFNSADALPASPCAVDASDFSALASKIGSEVGEAPYSICQDFNEDGYIDASDVSYFASARGIINECQ